MAIEPTLQSVLDATQALFRNRLGNSAQGSQAENERTSVASTQTAADRAQRDEDNQPRFLSDDRNSNDPQNRRRGSTLDLKI